jgi:hypothetical protein
MIIGIILCVLTAYYASKRGYNSVLWFFAGGLVGLVALSCLPDLKRLTPETIGQKRIVGNLVGVGLTLLAVCVGFAIAAVR